MRTLFVQGDKEFRVVISDTAKITFGPFNPASADIGMPWRDVEAVLNALRDMVALCPLPYAGTPQRAIYDRVRASIAAATHRGDEGDYVNGGGRGTLRIYESNQPNASILGVFGGVTSFRVVPEVDLISEPNKDKKTSTAYIPKSRRK